MVVLVALSRPAGSSFLYQFEGSGYHDHSNCHHDFRVRFCGLRLISCSYMLSILEFFAIILFSTYRFSILGSGTMHGVGASRDTGHTNSALQIRPQHDSSVPVASDIFPFCLRTHRFINHIVVAVRNMRLDLSYEDHEILATGTRSLTS